MAIVRSIVSIALLIGGIVAGITIYQRTQASPDYGPYPPLSEAAEPVAADDLTDLIVAGDDHQISQRYGDEVLGELAQALTFGPDPQNLSPIVDITDVRYLGAVSNGGETVALYATIGALSDGTDVVASLSIRVGSDGQVVGVN